MFNLSKNKNTLIILIVVVAVSLGLGAFMLYQQSIIGNLFRGDKQEELTRPDKQQGGGELPLPRQSGSTQEVGSTTNIDKDNNPEIDQLEEDINNTNIMEEDFSDL